ncbi:adenosylcobinamide-phosphate synthase CbiB [Clostridium sp.]|uniref:adenosylcobinamide-phosphate synthase CbiB n=1 Tax=Clostridium sp. TaxID=1506 RepID=UPI002A90E010|nr:adenosylcobinamide-phosphate synthase CbiB [Clostridium sp.]MDY6011545.1 adenosylcobinamide-phosphate synthase CbiB [Clostridium sp.]
MIKIIIGYLLDLIIGDPQNPYHPIRGIGKIAQIFENLFRKIFKKHLKLAGAITWIVVVSIVFLINFLLIKLLGKINPYIALIYECIAIYFCLSTKALKVEGLKVIKYVKEDNIEMARKQLSYIVGRDTDRLDKEAIMKAVIETVAENMSDGVIAPLFFVGLGGAPLMFLYKAVNTMDSMFGYKNDKYKEFGYFPAKLDDVFSYIPARLSAYLIIISSFLLRLDYKNAFKIYNRDKNNHTSPNSAHPESAAAGALGVRLGGANYYFGKLVKKPEIGDQINKITLKTVDDVNRILYLSSFLGVIVACVISKVIEVILC